MSILRSMRRAVISSLLLGTLYGGTPVAAQQTLNEQFLSAVEAGEWQQALDLIDQIIASDPGRRESLIPFREKYSQRLQIDQQLQQGNWVTASDLIDQYVATYSEDAQALNAYKAELNQLGELQRLAQQGQYVPALTQVQQIQQSSPRLRDLMTQYEQQLLSSIPRLGQPVVTPNFTLAVSQFRDVTSQVGTAAEETRQFLVGMTIQNTGSEPLAFQSGNSFNLYTRSGDTQFSAGRDAASALPDNTVLDPFNTTIQPGNTLQTGLVYPVPSVSEALYLTFGTGYLVRLR